MANLISTVSNAVKHWYLPLIAGILFIVFGVYIFTVPLDAYITLSVLFSISFLVAGIVEAYFAYANQDSLDGWGWYLVSGMLTFLLGIYLIAYPAISMATLPFVVGFTLLFRAFQGLGFALDLKKLGLSWGTLAFLSVLGIIFSFLLLAQPIYAALSLVTVTAISIIVVGVYGIMLSTTLKKLKDLPAKL